MGAIVPVLDAAPATAPVMAPAPASDPAMALAPCPQVVLSRPPQLTWMVRFDLRETARFLFNVAISLVSLATVALSCAMAARSLAVAVTRFLMTSTLYCWRYPSSGFVVAL